MQKVVALLVLIILLALLYGCGEPVTDGVIVEKYFKPGYYETTYMPVGDIMVPLTTYYSHHYCIVIEDRAGGRRSTYYVSDDEYEELEVGDAVDFSTGEEG